MEMINYIKSDLFRYAGKCNFKSFVKQYIRSEGFKFTVWLRVCHFTQKNTIYRTLIFPIAFIIYKHYKYKYGYDINYSADIGPGLLIYHISNIVLAPKKVGKNFTISHGCTVGMKIINGEKRFPIIGDNVYMAPGSKIIGDIEVGNNVAVGTNSVLNKSVENNSIVVGIPARIISNKSSKEYVNNPI